VSLDGAPVPADRLPLRLEVDAPAVLDVGAEASAPDPAADPAPRGRRAEHPAEDDGRRDDRASDRGEPALVTAEDLDEEAEAAADLLEGLLDALDLPGDLRISVQDAHAEVEVVGLEEGVLIGRRGQTLEAIQELVRTAMQRRFERRSRVLVDVDGYRARRLEKLLERADEAVREVLETGSSQRLEPMDSIERRLVHQRVAETPGVVSTSHGREPARRIVIEVAED
jgi:spoIIIJ-associated protein